MDLPESNTELATVANSGGTVYAGKTIIRLRNNVMDVTTRDRHRGHRPRRRVAGQRRRSTSPTTASCNGEIPTDADYDEPNGCGNVYVSGNYSSVAHDRGRQRRDHPPDGRRHAHRRSNDANITD